MGACNCCIQPIAAVYLEADQKHGSAAGAASTSAAWATAVAAIPSYSTYTDFAVAPDDHSAILTNPNNKNRDAVLTTYAASAYRARYRWRFYTATCYLKIWWDEVRRHIYGVFPGSITTDIISTTPFSFTWTPISEDGLCVPSGFTADIGGIADWSKSDDAGGPSPWEILEEEPADVTSPGGAFDTIAISVENVRFSLIDGFEPGVGEDSGFPS